MSASLSNSVTRLLHSRRSVGLGGPWADPASDPEGTKVNKLLPRAWYVLSCFLFGFWPLALLRALQRGFVLLQVLDAAQRCYALAFFSTYSTKYYTSYVRTEHATMRGGGRGDGRPPAS